METKEFEFKGFAMNGFVGIKCLGFRRFCQRATEHPNSVCRRSLAGLHPSHRLSQAGA